MSIPVNGPLSRRNGADFGITQDTDNVGGYRSVASHAERDAIPSSHLKLGMLVATQDDGKKWELTALSPVTWTEFTTSGSGIAVTRTADSAIVANTLYKLSTTAGRSTQYLAADYGVVEPDGTALTGAAGAGSTHSGMEVLGVETQLKSDGTTNIAPSDLVEPSPTVDGRIRKGSTHSIGKATSASNMTLNELVGVL